MAFLLLFLSFDLHTVYSASLPGITSGEKKGTFGIDENCTRGQIVTFLYRAK